MRELPDSPDLDQRPAAHREALLTRLLEALETAALRLGAEQIYEGGVSERRLYERLGYRGRNPMVKHLLPLPGRARDRLLQAITLEGRSP